MSVCFRRFTSSVRYGFVALLLAVILPCGVYAAPRPIDEGQFVKIGGIEQWVTIRGTDRTKPVILFLHGGPGDSQSALVSTYAPFEKDFVLVQWDQRNAGRTLARSNMEFQPASLELAISDGIELATFVKEHLHRKRLILVGHSWGSVLGVQMVARRPDLFSAFFGVELISSWREIVEAQYRYTLARAKAEQNLAAVKELEALGGPPSANFDQYQVLRNRLNQYLAPSDRKWAPKSWALIGQYLSAEDFKAYQKGLFAQANMRSVLTSIDTRAAGMKFKIPMFLIQGAEDHIADPSTALKYFSEIQALVKNTTVLAGAGHFSIETHTDKIWETIRHDLLLVPGPVK